VEYVTDHLNDATAYEAEFLPEFWRNVTPETLAAGHGGMDWFTYKAFTEALQSGAPMPVDVYDSATWQAVSVLSEISIQQGGAPQAMREGKLPLRVTHNDTKLNNILFDRETQEGICVIDLDTTMPGLSINDFGDSIRFGANHSREDEKDLRKVNFDIALYEAYVRGFLEGAQGCLTPAELEYLPWGARLMTLECGIRFLTDYLDGDNYFRIHYPEQNLDRCHTQFKLVQDMEAQFDQMAAIVKKYA